MSKIVTLTFNPCVDKSVTVSKLIPDKKIHYGVIQLDPGGGGINVARGIKRLGGDVVAIYPSGGYHGQLLTSMLEEEGVKVLPVVAEENIRENWMVFEKASSKQYRVVTPGPGFEDEVWNLCLEKLNNLAGVRFIVVSGSMPPDFPKDIFQKIKIIANKKNAKIIVDTSGKALQLALKSGVYLLKPNLSELEELVSSFNFKDGSPEAASKEIIKSKFAEIVVISRGEKGATCVTSDRSFEIKSPPTVKNGTVGAGDSLLAGIVFMLAKNKSLRESVEFGVACGAAATLNRGTELFQPKEARNLQEKMRKAMRVVRSDE